MARFRTLSLANSRHLLLALIAVALVFRLGTACEAMAAAPSGPVAQQAHCADMPDTPIKSDVAACAMCGALPDAAPAATARIAFDQQDHAPAPNVDLAGITGGPAPPPPKIA